MIKVLFFASLKETLQCAELHVSGSNPLSVEELKVLIEKQLAGACKLLNQANILCAVNQNMVTKEATVLVKDGDEVAFFPPVTGG